MRWHPLIRQKQRGQVLPLGIALLAFSALLMLVLFNSGQVISEKTKLSSTADASVYSGLVWQARSLNFISYTNRAMVANQVSIAQLVSLSSWTEYGDITARNINNTIGMIPPLRPFTQAVDSTMSTINTIVGNIVDAGIPIIDDVISLISDMQEAVYLSTFGITPSIIREVAQANDPDYDTETAYSVSGISDNLNQWRDFIREYGVGDDAEEELLRKADIIERSRDRFTRSRGWSVGSFFLTPTHKVKLRKEGTTNLIYDPDEESWAWMAKDTLSLHTHRFRCSWRGCRWRHSETPIGWGAAVTPEEQECQQVRGWGRWWFRTRDYDCQRFVRHNRRAERLANREMIGVGDYSGVQAYYDLADLSEENQDPRFTLIVEVEVDQNAIRTSSVIDGVGSANAVSNEAIEDGIGTGMFRVDPEFAGSTMAAMSAAEVYFKRPDYEDRFRLRVNGRVQQEYGNLFNPYWQVRLIDVERNQRLAAWAARSEDLVAETASAVARAQTRYIEDQRQDLERLQQLETYAEGQQAQLGEYDRQRTQLNETLVTTENNLTAAETALNDAVAAGGAASVIAQRQAEVDRLTTERDRVARELTSVNQRIQNANNLNAELADIRSTISGIEGSINEGAQSIESEYTNDINAARNAASRLSEGTVSGMRDQIARYESESYADAVQLTDELEEILEDAAMAVLGQAITSSVPLVSAAQQAQERLETIENNVMDAVDQVREDLVGPIEDQLEQIEAGFTELETEIRSAAEQGIQDIQGDIDSIAGSIESRVQGLEDRLQSEMDALNAELLSAVDTDEIARLESAIDAQRERLVSEADTLRTSLENQVDELTQARDDMRASVEQSVNDARRELDAEAEALREQLRART